jgi:hypothetical protein
MIGSDTAQQQRRSVFLRRPIATARAIALRVVDLLVFDSRASVSRVATPLPATFRNRLEDNLQESLFSSTKHAEVKDRRQVDRLLSHDRLSKDNSS